MEIDVGEKKKAHFTREYIDYDDPTQFDGQGQRLGGQQASLSQQHQFQQHQQQMLFKQGQTASSQAGVDRQLVSYDDLF